jgi:outer membrane biosynthesis protein TonB
VNAEGGCSMTDKQESGSQQTGMKKVFSIKDDPFYSNCTMIETSPFDVSVLFGRVRPTTDAKGNSVLVEIYEKQVYLSHLQAKALHDALGRSLASMAERKPETKESEPEPQRKPQPRIKAQPATKPRAEDKPQPERKPQPEDKSGPVTRQRPLSSPQAVRKPQPQSQPRPVRQDSDPKPKGD